MAQEPPNSNRGSLSRRGAEGREIKLFLFELERSHITHHARARLPVAISTGSSQLLVLLGLSVNILITFSPVTDEKQRQGKPIASWVSSLLCASAGDLSQPVFLSKHSHPMRSIA